MMGYLGHWQFWVAVVLVVVIAHLVLMKFLPSIGNAVGSTS